MKYAILSDIHSNPVAFEQALEDARVHDVDKIICLGDVVGYGPDPARTVELVCKNCDVVLMGNHDAAVRGWRVRTDTSAVRPTGSAATASSFPKRTAHG